METYVYVAAGIFSVVLAILYWLGILTTMKIKEAVFKGGIFIYTDYRSSIKNVG